MPPGRTGSLLAELLLDRGYEVFGVVRQPRSEPYKNLCNVSDRIQLVEADLLDEDSLVNALRTARPHEVYNLAAPSFVPASWKHPVLTAQFAAVGATALLEAIRLNHPTVRFYQASSSEIFGDPLETPQTEQTPLSPLTPYGIAKAYAHFIVRSYRTRYGLHASSGILYNHESPRRPLNLSRGRLRVQRQPSSSGSRAKSGSATSMRAVTGAGHRLRRRHVADAATGGGRRLRDRYRRHA